MAEEFLKNVQCPVLLIVGEKDKDVIQLNEKAKQLLVQCELKIIPNATHLFSEPGTLDIVAKVSADWLKEHLIDATENWKNERQYFSEK